MTKCLIPTKHSDQCNENKSERPVDALSVKNINHSLTDSPTDNLKSRDASASKNMVMMAKTGGNDHFDQHDESCDN